METMETDFPLLEAGTEISSLFPEILSLIFSYLDVKDKGRVAQVCATWKNAAYNRMVWKGVEAKLHLRRANPSLFPSLVKRGIKRVQVLSLRRSLRDVINGVDNLESLNLSGCFNVTDVGLGHAFVKDLAQLTSLNLSLCKQITDSSLGRIAQSVRNLDTLNLGGCSNITSSGLLLLGWGLRKLKKLSLRSCRHVSDMGIYQICGSNPDEDNGMLQLETLDLQDCQKLSDQALKYISDGLNKLKSLNLSFCSCVTDTGLRYLAKMPSLDELNLRSCDNISDIGLGFLAEGGSRVLTLDVSFCERIGDSALLHISQGLFHMKSLSICACPITDDGINKIARTLHELTTLNIGQCSKITDKGLCLVADNMKNLSSIDLYGCTKITTVGLEKIVQMPQLSTMNLGLWHKQ